MKIPIVGCEKEFATDIQFTPTGPVALIGGVWYSVNGNEKEIMDVRHTIRDEVLLKELGRQQPGEDAAHVSETK